MFKKQLEDERIIGENRRFNTEGLGIIFWALMLDIFYRSVILRQDIMLFWDIALIFFGTCFYLVVRKIVSGTFAFEGMKKAWRTIIMSSVLAGISMSATFYFVGTRLTPQELIMNFLIGTLTFGLIMSLFYYVSNRRANR